MKKRILSLLLVMAMLLSVVPMIGSAEEASNQGVWYGRSLTLGSGIAINFVTEEAVTDFGKVEFEVNGQVVQRYSTAEEGQTSFAFTRLTPSKLGQDVTAKMYNTEGEVIGEITTNVLSYCEAALAGDNAALKKLCVDLLNYGAATQTYVGSTDTLVNAVLTEQQAALGTSEYFPVRLVTDQSFYDYGEQTSATWYGAGLVLNDTITMRLQYITETPDTYVTVLVGDDRVLDLESTLVDEEKNLYEVYYNGLKPSEFSVARGFLICDASHAKISQKLTYSMESYAYSVKNNPTTYADEVALIDALTDYCRSVCELNGHSFTKGICDTCGVEKVFIMDSESITIQAEDAILGNIQSLQDSDDSADGKTVQLWRTYDATQAQGKTAKDYAGDIVVKFIPKYSGTYTVQAKVSKTGTTPAHAMVVTENDIATYYSRAGLGSATGVVTDDLLDATKTFTLEAGKPYAIRIAATTINMLFDKFIITHTHEYDDDKDTTCNGCGQEREVAHTCEFSDEWSSDATHHWHECACGAKADSATHSFTNGICTVCNANKTFVLSATSEKIFAMDAVLNTKTNGRAAIYKQANANSDAKTLIQLNSRFKRNSTSGDENFGRFQYSDTTHKDTGAAVYAGYLTSENDPGNVIIYVKPTVSGTYNLTATAWVSGLNYVGLFVEDDNSNPSDYYESVEFAKTKTGTETVNNATSFGTTDMGTYEWTAGKTYAIRILSSNSNVSFDYFTITNVTP